MGAAYQLRRNDMDERNGKEARNLSKHWGIIHEGKGFFPLYPQHQAYHPTDTFVTKVHD